MPGWRLPDFLGGKRRGPQASTASRADRSYVPAGRPRVSREVGPDGGRCDDDVRMTFLEDRRRKRSEDPLVALHYQLAHARQRGQASTPSSSRTTRVWSWRARAPGPCARSSPRTRPCSRRASGPSPGAARVPRGRAADRDRRPAGRGRRPEGAPLRARRLDAGDGDGEGRGGRRPDPHPGGLGAPVGQAPQGAPAKASRAEDLPRPLERPSARPAAGCPCSRSGTA